MNQTIEGLMADIEREVNMVANGEIIDAQAQNVREDYLPQFTETDETFGWLAFKVTPRGLYVRYEPDHCGFEVTRVQLTILAQQLTFLASDNASFLWD